MTEEEALFVKWEHADSQQGSNSEGALSQIGARPSGRQVGKEEFDSDEVEVVYSEDPGMVEPKGTQGNIGTEPVVEESHPRKAFF